MSQEKNDRRNTRNITKNDHRVIRKGMVASGGDEGDSQSLEELRVDYSMFRYVGILYANCSS